MAENLNNNDLDTITFDSGVNAAIEEESETFEDLDMSDRKSVV